MFFTSKPIARPSLDLLLNFLIFRVFGLHHRHPGTTSHGVWGLPYHWPTMLLGLESNSINNSSRSVLPGQSTRACEIRPVAVPAISAIIPAVSAIIPAISATVWGPDF